jgi:hypothetical protein
MAATFVHSLVTVFTYGNGKFCGIPVIKLPGRKCPLLGKADIIRQPLPVVFELYLEIMISIYFRVGCTK